MKEKGLQRILDNNMNALKVAAQRGDFELVKYLILSILEIPKLCPDANILNGLSVALVEASNRSNNQDVITLIVAAISNEASRLERKFSEASSGISELDEHLEDVDDSEEIKSKDEVGSNGVLKSVLNMAGSAVNYVVDSDTRDEASEEIKENAKNIGKTIKNVYGKTKDAVATATSKENLEVVSDKIGKITKNTINKVQKLGEDLKTKLQEIESETKYKENEEDEEDEELKIYVDSDSTDIIEKMIKVLIKTYNQIDEVESELRQRKSQTETDFRNEEEKVDEDGDESED